ncbi:PLP-dependent aminotransferase family protein [Herpetosiphon llansteffanensis]|uniref:MocR-like pyridoxine biosynthesis transcription factor PdxR n=1 Tax=Herpetosiphon llansteffanensis TaxID=2094568 RepID=UPI000D7D1CF5|nr:PLP-dependent aminotransferase family protein [Herpetosiphon llansteffanensis]
MIKPLLLSVDSQPLYQQLYQHLRQAILTGELKRGMQLPSSRSLASQLSLSRNTVLNAYEQLIAEGYLESYSGQGTFVSSSLPELDLPTLQSNIPAHTSQAQHRLADHALDQMYAPQMTDNATSAHLIGQPLSSGIPAIADFPSGLWQRLQHQQIRHLGKASLGYQDAKGYAPLREAIAKHISLTRQVQCSPEQILITNGAQAALNLAIHGLLNPGEQAWMEDPGYLGVRGVLLGAGATIVPVPVDHDGLQVASGIALAPHARLVYVTPSHQFPLGSTLSLSRRLQLLEWAAQQQAYILEDDYDSEYRYAGRPIASLYSLDQAERVLYVGTFSKVLFPALRIGYLVVPPNLVEPFTVLRRLADVHTPLINQATLAEFINAGHFSRHIHRMCQLYAQRREYMLQLLNELGLEVNAPPAGMYCTAWLPAGINAQMVSSLAAQRGLMIENVNHFALRPISRQGILIGYAGFSPEVMRAGIEQLGQILQQLQTGTIN